MAPDGARTALPDGFGKAKLGMSPQEVAKLYPELKKLDREVLGATPVFSPFVVRQLIPSVALAGAPHPVPVELRYWKDKLWVIIVYNGQNSDEQMTDAFTALCGKPSADKPGPAWFGEKVSISSAPKQHWYALADNALSKQAQELFAEEMARQRQMAARRGAAAVPAASAPAAAAESGGK